MPTLIEKYAYPGPPKYTAKGNLSFDPVNLPVPELYTTIYMDIIMPPSQLEFIDYTIIYSHGNAEHLNNYHFFLEDLSKILYCRVVSYDYLGYGGNHGAPTEDSSNRLVIAVYNYVKATYPSTQIISWGRSIGSVPAVHLAATQYDVGYLIIYSGLSSGTSVVFKHTCCCSCIDQFKNYIKIKKVKCKILILHGTEDEIIPYRCSLMNFQAYVSANRLDNCVVQFYSTKHYNLTRYAGNITHISVHGAGHNDMDTCYEETVVDAVKDLLGDDFSNCSCENRYVRDYGRKQRVTKGILFVE